MDINMDININIYIEASVKLTQYGAEVLNKYNHQFHISTDKEQNEKMFPTNWRGGDVYKSQLLNIMHIFGPYMYTGATTVFDKNILTINPDEHVY